MRSAFCSLILSAVVIGCADTIVPPETLEPKPMSQHPLPIGPASGVVAVPPAEDPIAGADPSPGANGLWLGNGINPSFCFADQNPGVADADHDWLADLCEYKIARGFRPEWQYGNAYCNDDGEPHWAAKYFTMSDVGDTFLPHAIVRIAYIPAYYADCGPEWHTGDSELVMVDVQWVPSTQHWELTRAWMSAHYGVGSGDRSQWYEKQALTYRGPYFGFPTVYASENKHANYASVAMCEDTWYSQIPFMPDDCHDDWPSVDTRFDVLSSRNVGSRHRDGMTNSQFHGCETSHDRPDVPQQGNRQECFYGTDETTFNGWWAIGSDSHTDGVTAYRELLMGLFEPFYNGAMGPGPQAPPPLPSMSVSISGPNSVKPNVSCSFAAVVSGGTPASYYWQVGAAPAGTSSNVNVSQSTSYTLSVRVTSTTGEVVNKSKNVTVSSSAPTCFS